MAAGDPESALRDIRTACGILEEIGAKYELGIARLRHAEFLLSAAPASREDLTMIWREATDSLRLFLDVDVPWWIRRADALVGKVSALKEQAAKSRDTKTVSVDIIVHESPVMRDLLQMCDMYAGSGHPVLVRGETGTGKELIARRLHTKSGRKGKLVAVNTASISPSLFESAFFGHVKGSFSGADRNRLGFASEADGGTLFLDEIGELSLELQPKLLRLLQDGVFHAVGDPDERRVDVRLVAATNKDLHAAVRAGRFREDLLYRLQVLTLDVPPLRDRVDDVPLLMEHFLSLEAGRKVSLSEYLNTPSVARVREYRWPGNVREVIAVCRQLHLQISSRGSARVVLGGEQDVVLTGPGYLEMVAAAGSVSELRSIADPKQRIIAALERSNGTRSVAARLLGISRSTLYRQMERLGL
jgi:transcriptional regulator with GAF, ATPase, and Fis domain